MPLTGDCFSPTYLSLGGRCSAFSFTAPPALICPSSSHTVPPHVLFLTTSFAIVCSISCFHPLPLFIMNPLCICPYHRYLIFLLFVSRFCSPVCRAVSGGCGTTLSENRSLPSSLETSTAPPRSTEVTTGYLPFACSSLSPLLLY